MKKFVVLVALGIQSVVGMYVLNSRIPLLSPGYVRQQYAFNTHRGLGKTHFIVGYNHAAPRNSAPSYNSSAQEATTTLNDERIMQPFFTSRHNVRAVLADLIDQAEESILIAAFALTDADIAKRLEKAHKAGIVVEVVTDCANMNERYSKTKKLAQAHIPVYYYNAQLNKNPHQKNSPYARMHHKFLIIDKKIGVNGSTNLTKSGQQHNVENIMVFRDPQVIDEFVQEFEHVKGMCERCAAERKST